ncbi:MAG: hypothetical protein AAGA85_09735 [Bacteroidota bacterium]
MKVSFDHLPDHARLWVYQGTRPFTDHELSTIKSTLDAFIDQWQAHGKPLSAGYDIRYDQFIVLAVDESVHGATGCSIDGSVALVRQLEEHLSMSLLDRGLVAVETLQGLEIVPFNQVKAKIEAGEIQEKDTVFNNSVATMADFKAGWQTLAGESWLKRHFKVTQ